MVESNRYTSLSDEQFYSIHFACERFERALQHGEPIRIEDCLASVSDEIRFDLLRELMAIELEQFESNGARPIEARSPCEERLDDEASLRAGYHVRFPDCLAHIERVFGEMSTARTEKKLPGTGRVYPQDNPTPFSVPGYEIVNLLGRGAMGVVYKARDLKLKRIVALKMIRAGGDVGQHELARFRLEAEAVARLQHPNIVQIHEVGVSNGHPYCAFEFVDGVNLASKLGAKPMPAQEAAKLVEKLARAIQLAHTRNIVHRDLKPANILLAHDGTPKITDFGLARHLDSDSGETQAGTLIGTPSYMAPEQASGQSHEAGAAADVYALGAILYDCLVGRPPFQGKSIVDTLDQVRTRQPIAPRRLQANVPPDLETICLKCLLKEPENRYASAMELADELFRYQRGEPILARPVGLVERAGKWIRRNPVVAALLAGVAGIVLIAFLLVSWSYLRAEDALRKEEKQHQAADQAHDAALREQRAERWGRYRSNIAAASAALQIQNNTAARSALDDAPIEHRNWEWHYLDSQLNGAHLVLPMPGGNISAISLNTSGRQFAALSYAQNEINLYNVATGQLEAVCRGHLTPPTDLMYRRDGQQIVSIDIDEHIHIWESATGRELAHLDGNTSRSNRSNRAQIAYNADGSRIVSSIVPKLGVETASGMSRLWDANTHEEIAVLSNSQQGADRVEFSPDGKRVVVTAGELAYLCDAVTGGQLATLGPHASRVLVLAYSPDGKRLVTSADSTIYLWDGESGKAIAELRGHTSHVLSLVFSPDGSRLISTCDYPEFAARLWDTSNGQSLAVLAGHKNLIRTVAFSPDGNQIATAGEDQQARLWDGITGQMLAVMRGHTGVVRHVVFPPNSGTAGRVVTAADDSTLRFWDAQTGESIGMLRGHNDVFFPECPPVFTPDGSRLLSCSADGTVRIWELSLAERYVLRGHESFVYDVAISPDGEQLASAGWDGTARLWNAATGKQTGLLKHDSSFVGAVAWSPDGLSLATRERHSAVTLWDVGSLKVKDVWKIPAWGSVDPRVAFNAQGTHLASGTSDGSVRIWDMATRQEIARLDGHDSASLDVAFHPDGNLLASCGAHDLTIRLWDVQSRSMVAVLRGHTNVISRVAFSSDGKFLASASSDATIGLWDTTTHEQLAVLFVGRSVYDVSFSPDGTRLAAGCADNTIRLFDMASRQQVAELRGHTDYVHAIAWSPDGTRLISGSGDATVCVWDSLSPSVRPRAALLQAR